MPWWPPDRGCGPHPKAACCRSLGSLRTAVHQGSARGACPNNRARCAWLRAGRVRCLAARPSSGWCRSWSCLSLVSHAALEADVWQNGLRFEEHSVVVRVDRHCVHLFDEKSYVVRQAKKVLLEGCRTCLARHGNRARLVVVAERAQTLDGQHVIAGDAVVKHNAPRHLEIVCGLGDGLRHQVGIAATTHRDHSRNRCKEALIHASLFTSVKCLSSQPSKFASSAIWSLALLTKPFSWNTKISRKVTTPSGPYNGRT